MNKREAQQKLVAYKNEKREEQYEIEHGALSNFKAKYLEKIPLGNGKFRYIYEEAKDKVSSAAKNVANNIKTAVNPGAMTENEKSIRSSTNQARADVKKQQEANARKAAIEEINRRATTNAQSPNAADARMQFAKQAVAENQNKADYLNKQKNAKPTGADRADKIEKKDNHMDDEEKIQYEREKNHAKGREIKNKYKVGGNLDSSLIEKDLNEEFKNNTKNDVSELMSLASEVKKYDDSMKELAKEKGALNRDGSIDYHKLYIDGNRDTAEKIGEIDYKRRDAQAKYKKEIIGRVSGLTSQYADLSTRDGSFDVNIVGDIYTSGMNDPLYNGANVSDYWQKEYANRVDVWANSMMKELTKNVQATDRSKESAARKAASEAINKRTK